MNDSIDPCPSKVMAGLPGKAHSPKGPGLLCVAISLIVRAMTRLTIFYTLFIINPDGKYKSCSCA